MYKKWNGRNEILGTRRFLRGFIKRNIPHEKCVLKTKSGELISSFRLLKF